MPIEWGKYTEPIRGHLVAQGHVRVDRVEHGGTRITQTNLTSAIQTHQRTTPVTTPEAEPTDPWPTQISEEAAPSEPAAPGTCTGKRRSFE
jgi:hypothetical protein